jgi:hypothetical protein
VTLAIAPAKTTRGTNRLLMGVDDITPVHAQGDTLRPSVMASTRLIGGLGFAEGPRWLQGRLWFSDFGERVVRAVDLDGTAQDVVRVAASPSGLGWLPDGSLLVVSMTDQRLLRTSSSGTVEHADLSRFTPTACNDMVVDAHGNAYVGYMGFDRRDGSRLLRVRARRSGRAHALSVCRRRVRSRFDGPANRIHRDGAGGCTEQCDALTTRAASIDADAARHVQIG